MIVDYGIYRRTHLHIKRQTAITSIMLVPIFALGIAAGFRLFGFGADYLNYLDFYNNLRLLSPLEYTRFEPSFTLSAWVAKFIFETSYQPFLAVMVTAALIVKYRVFLKTNHPLLTLLFYLANWYPLHEYTQVRAAIAISILFLALEYIITRRRVHFILAVLLAASFHYSSIFAAALILLTHWLARFRLWTSIPALMTIAFAMPMLLMHALIPFATMLNPLTGVYIANSGLYELPTILSGANILSALFLLLAPLCLPNMRNVPLQRIVYLLSVASLLAFIGLRDIPIFAHRLREMGMVFMTLLSFNYRITWSRTPLVFVAFALCLWSLHKSISQGIIWDF